MEHKLEKNADYFFTIQSKIAYIYSHIFLSIFQHFCLKMEKNLLNKFISIEDMFEILQKVYGDINKKHTIQVKFQDLCITKNFNTFWTEFLLLVLELKAHKSRFIVELQQKLTPILSQALATLPKQTNFITYAKQCCNAYQNFWDFNKRMNKLASIVANYFICIANFQIATPNIIFNQQISQPAIFLYV